MKSFFGSWGSSLDRGMRVFTLWSVSVCVRGLCEAFHRTHLASGRRAKRCIPIRSLSSPEPRGTRGRSVCDSRQPVAQPIVPPAAKSLSQRGWWCGHGAALNGCTLTYLHTQDGVHWPRWRINESCHVDIEGAAERKPATFF